MTYIRIAALGLGLLAAAPAAASASQPIAYDTALTALYGSPAPYTGTLELRISAKGLVSGYYLPAGSSGAPLTVTGGTSGSSIWFDIGEDGTYHFSGKLNGGTIAGTAFTADNHVYTLVAKPQR